MTNNNILELVYEYGASGTKALERLSDECKKIIIEAWSECQKHLNDEDDENNWFFEAGYDYLFAKADLKGVLDWWNSLVKDEFKSPLTESEFIAEVLEKAADLPAIVEIPAQMAKSGRTELFK